MSRLGAVLWTGGKDCTLALCRARDAGIHIIRLATFYPAGEDAPFKAHPIEQLRAIAREANLEHELIPVTPPYRDSYVAGLKHLRGETGIEAVITGDIDLVDGQPNWIRECAAALDLEVITPLWQRSRLELLNEIVSRGIPARVSWIDSPEIPKQWLGRIIDPSFIADIRALAATAAIDPCGENGEYHTMVDYIPRSGFTRSIHVRVP